MKTVKAVQRILSIPKPSKRHFTMCNIFSEISVVLSVFWETEFLARIEIEKIRDLETGHPMFTQNVGCVSPIPKIIPRNCQSGAPLKNRVRYARVNDTGTPARCDYLCGDYARFVLPRIPPGGLHCISSESDSKRPSTVKVNPPLFWPRWKCIPIKIIKNEFFLLKSLTCLSHQIILDL